MVRHDIDARGRDVSVVTIHTWRPHLEAPKLKFSGVRPTDASILFLNGGGGLGLA
jgi:hypothetical protein